MSSNKFEALGSDDSQDEETMNHQQLEVTFVQMIRGLIDI